TDLKDGLEKGKESLEDELASIRAELVETYIDQATKDLEHQAQIEGLEKRIKDLQSTLDQSEIDDDIYESASAMSDEAPSTVVPAANFGSDPEGGNEEEYTEEEKSLLAKTMALINEVNATMGNSGGRKGTITEEEENPRDYRQELEEAVKENERTNQQFDLISKRLVEEETAKAQIDEGLNKQKGVLDEIYRANEERIDAEENEAKRIPQEIEEEKESLKKSIFQLEEKCKKGAKEGEELQKEKTKKTEELDKAKKREQTYGKNTKSEKLIKELNDKIKELESNI